MRTMDLNHRFGERVARVFFTGFCWCMSIVDESVCRMCVAFALKFIYLTQITLYNVLQFNSHDISRRAHYSSLPVPFDKFHSIRLSTHTISIWWIDTYIERRVLHATCTASKYSFCTQLIVMRTHWHMWQNADGRNEKKNTEEWAKHFVSVYRFYDLL